MIDSIVDTTSHGGPQLPPGQQLPPNHDSCSGALLLVPQQEQILLVPGVVGELESKAAISVPAHPQIAPMDDSMQGEGYHVEIDKETVAGAALAPARMIAVSKHSLQGDGTNVLPQHCIHTTLPHLQPQPPSAQNQNNTTAVSNLAPTFNRLFPFFIAVDKNFRIVDAGHALQKKVARDTDLVGQRVDGHCKILAPRECEWDWEDLKMCAEAEFELEFRVPSTAEATVDVTYLFAGSLFVTDDSVFKMSTDTTVGGSKSHHNHSEDQSKSMDADKNAKDPFLASGDAEGASFNSSPPSPHGPAVAYFLIHPDIWSVAEMEKYNLTLSDFPKHSAQCKLIYLTEHLQSETFLGEVSRKQAENTEHLLEMKRMFVRYVSHELRTPLNTVSLGLNLVHSILQKREEDEDKRSLEQQERKKGGDDRRTRRHAVLLEPLSTMDKALEANDPRDHPQVPSVSSAPQVLRLFSPAALEEVNDDSQTASPTFEALHSERRQGQASGERQVIEEIMESCDEALTILNDLLMYEKMEDGGGFVLEKKEEPVLSLIQSVRGFDDDVQVLATVAIILVV
jgi:hypothetical protein